MQEPPYLCLMKDPISGRAIIMENPLEDTIWTRLYGGVAKIWELKSKLRNLKVFFLKKMLNILDNLKNA